MKRASIYLKGGFGNQVFQYCLANYLRSQNYKVVIDTHFYEKNFEKGNNTPREIIFEPNLLGFKKTSNLYKNLLKILRKVNSLEIKFFTYEFFKGYDFNEEKVKDFNEFDGYWQNTNLLSFNKEFIKNTLENIPLIKNALSFPREGNNSFVHIRRRDYIQMSEELNIFFYEKSLEYLKNNIAGFKFDIFTDDYEWVKSQQIFNKAENIYSENDLNNDPIETFATMLSYNNFIVGNSTFSLIAAFIAESDSSIVVIADPWFREIRHPGFDFENWIKIENK